MKNLKKLATTLTLAGIIIIGATNAQAGLLMSDFTGGSDQPQPCTERTEKVDRGIIFEFTGIIFELVGINSKSGETRTDCGILMSD